MAILSVARHHMPMKVGRDIAQAGDVDLVGAEDFAQRGLGCEHRVHQPHTLLACKIGHLGHMALKNHPAEAGIIRVADQNHTAEFVAP